MQSVYWACLVQCCFSFSGAAPASSTAPAWFSTTQEGALEISEALATRCVACNFYPAFLPDPNYNLRNLLKPPGVIGFILAGSRSHRRDGHGLPGARRDDRRARSSRGGDAGGAWPGARTQSAPLSDFFNRHVAAASDLGDQLPVARATTGKVSFDHNDNRLHDTPATRESTQTHT